MSVEAATVCRWAASKGIQTELQTALFDDNVRGLAAACDLPAGAVAVRVPENLLISHDTAKKSDLASAVQDLWHEQHIAE